MSESVKNEMGSMEEVLGLMDRVNEVFSYEVWIPSLNKNVMFRELNTNQQKRLIKAIIDSPVYNTEFIFALKKIIQENCVDSNVNVDELTIMDKAIIAMKMRSVSIGDIIELKIPVGTEENPSTIQRGISIEKLLKDIKKNIKLPDPEIITDERGVYSITCSIPTILAEYKLEDEMRKNSNSRDIKNYDELRQSVGDIFMGEIAKYIKDITIGDGDKSTTIDLNALSFKNRITLIGKLPERIVKNVVKYIEKTKKAIDGITLVKVNIGTEEEPEIKEEKFSIEASFFTGS